MTMDQRAINSADEEARNSNSKPSVIHKQSMGRKREVGKVTLSAYIGLLIKLVIIALLVNYYSVVLQNQNFT